MKLVDYQNQFFITKGLLNKEIIMYNIINYEDTIFPKLQAVFNMINFESDYTTRLEQEKSKKHKKSVIPSNTKTVIKTPSWSLMNKL